MTDIENLETSCQKENEKKELLKKGLNTWKAMERLTTINRPDFNFYIAINC